MRTLPALAVASLMIAGVAAAATTGLAVKPRHGAERAWMDADLGCWTADVTLQIGETVWTFTAEVEAASHAFCEVAFTVCPSWGCGSLVEHAKLRNASLGFEADGLLVLHPCRVLTCAQADPEVCCHPAVTAEGYAGRIGATRFATVSDPCDTPFFVCTKDI